MNFLNIIKQRVNREMFLPTYLGLVVNPFYIIRNGLYQEIKRFAPELKGKILDFGCGSKPYRSLFSDSQSYVGVDIQVSGHDHSTSSVDFFYDGKVVPFNDEFFDGVVSFETLEHVFEIRSILNELSRVLKSGGYLLISVPFAWDEHEVPYDCARYTSFGVEYVLRESGFEIIEIRKSSTYVLAIAQLAIAYLSQHVLPSKKGFRHFFQVVVIFPLTLMAYGLNRIFPKRYEFFCNSVVFARKK